MINSIYGFFFIATVYFTLGNFPLHFKRQQQKKPQPFQPSINKYIMIERVLENQSTVT